MQRRQLQERAFTLIELLIVVAIITILAAIAVPNFLEAMTRAKVSRVQSDLRTIATGLESYRTENNDYPPNDGIYNVLPRELSTPISYLTNTNLVDPFTDRERHPVHGELARFYTYQLIVKVEEVAAFTAIGRPPAIEAIDAPFLNEGALAFYGRWRMVSNGPDRVYSQPGLPIDPFNLRGNVLLGSDIPYDPTNGTVSFGNIHRTQRHGEKLPPRTE